MISFHSDMLHMTLNIMKSWQLQTIELLLYNDGNFFCVRAGSEYIYFPLVVQKKQTTTSCAHWIWFLKDVSIVVMFNDTHTQRETHLLQMCKENKLLKVKRKLISAMYSSVYVYSGIISKTHSHKLLFQNLSRDIRMK